MHGHDWTNQTTLHPLGLLAVMLLGTIMLLVPRRYAVVPMLVMACCMSPAQRVVVLTLDFNLLRVLVLFGWFRVLLMGETRGFRWRLLDPALLLWAAVGTVTYTLQTGQWPMLINRLGVAFDAVGMYFLFRMLVRDWDDVRVIAASAAILSVPVAAVFMIEHRTARNMFSIFGGVPEITMMRAGRLRCQGPFTHPIMAGCFWAALLPLIGALWWHRSWQRWLVPLGTIGALLIVVTTASSTPLSAVIFGAAAWSLYPLRHFLGWIRAAGLFGLVLLQLVMNNPIWYLIARADLVGGSTGWYRYKLIDVTVRHFDEWWLIGTRSYADWWTYGGSDLTCEYVRQALLGGLGTLLLFVAAITIAFLSVRSVQRRVAHDRFARMMAWGLGCTLFVHATTFLAVAYFGQMDLIWYLSLGIVGSLTPARHARVQRRAAQRALMPAGAPREHRLPATS